MTPASGSPAPDARQAARDSALLDRLRRGEEAAFEELVRLHGGRMLSVAKRFLRNEDDARDAVQDAFLSAFRALDGFEGGSRLSTWLHRIVVNAALMKLRTRRRKPEEPIDDLLPKFLADGHMAEPAVAWPDSALERKQLQKLVRDRIDQLPETYRIVLLLRDVEDLDTEETAELLGLKTGAVKTRLHRARLALRTLLDAEMRGDPT